MYTTLYGKSHFDRFSTAISQIMGCHVRQATVTKTINVIDYGCGQGIASLALLNYLEQHVNCQGFTIHFHLVEPSHTTLALAASLVTKMSSRIATQVTIHQYQQDLATFLTANHKLMTADYAIHLFSNILDIAAVQALIPTLSDYLHRIEGKNMVIAVGPQYSSNYKGFEQLRDALHDVNVKQDAQDFVTESEIYSIKHHHWNHQKSYGVMMGLCFKNSFDDERGTDLAA